MLSYFSSSLGSSLIFFKEISVNPLFCTEFDRMLSYLCSSFNYCLNGIEFVYRLLLKTNTPDVPGPPKNLCGEKKIASSFFASFSKRNKF